MPAPLLATKLYAPPPRTGAVSRLRLIEQLSEGLRRKLTLVCAPAGFGKTTLVSGWLSKGERPIAWLSLDEGDSDPARFLAYFVAALQQVATIGEGVQRVLSSPQPLPMRTILTPLLNDLAAAPEPFTLILDDYHLVDSQAVNAALTFLLEHLPPKMHLVIIAREDPPLPLARLRARDQLSELRATDLRFTFDEAADFLKSVMGLTLSADDVTLLETRTEGWIAGLQLAALSMQGHGDASGFIRSFGGSNRFVLDYLLEEVLQRQSERVQDFLLKTSILERLCGSLCDAVLGDSATSGQATLESLERANLFLVPLDNERRWYRYHHLFAELLRQRLRQGTASFAENEVGDLHIRASTWFEDNGLELEAFRHAARAGDLARAARLVEGEGMPLLFRGAVAPVLGWLESLPRAALDTYPSLWVIYASALIFVGQPAPRIEATLREAERALRATFEDGEPDEATRDQLGHVASIRATLAIPRREVETILAESHRALAYLHPDNLPVRTATAWTLGFAYQLRGARAAARRAFSEAITRSEAIGHIVINIAATTGLGHLQETDNQLRLAAQTYRRALHLAGEPPWSIACEAQLGLARLYYEWNDLDTARTYAQKSVHLAQQQNITDTFASCKVFLARLNLGRGDVAGAVTALAEAAQFVLEHTFTHQLPEIAAARVLILLEQDSSAAAMRLAQTHDLPLGQARVYLAQGDPAAALAILAPLRRRSEAKGWADEQLKATVLEALAYHRQGDEERAAQHLDDALASAEPGGFVRTFVGEGAPMAQLVSVAAARGVRPDYTAKLLAAFAEKPKGAGGPPRVTSSHPLVEPLSPRELEILRLIAQGLSNREIGERLFRAVSTVKGHNQVIFGKLQVQNRTQAVARARELGLL